MYACRNRALAALLAHLDRTDVPGDQADCEQPAMWATAVYRKGDGLDVETYTQTCDPHDRQLHTDRGYQLSKRLRRS